MSGIAEAKAALRREIRSRIAALSAEDRQRQGEFLLQRIREFEPWQAARSVLLFMPLPDEIDLRLLMDDAVAAGKSVALPAFDSTSQAYVARQVRDPEDLHLGRFQIIEPRPGCPITPFSALDLVVVPGLAYDPAGNRLGRGKGFYDRMLALTPDAVSCGVGFDEQVVPLVPVEPHDVKLRHVLTPTRLPVGRPAPV